MIRGDTGVWGGAKLYRMILQQPLMVQTGLKDAIRIQTWGKTLVPRNILVSLANFTMGANCYCDAALFLD